MLAQDRAFVKGRTAKGGKKNRRGAKDPEQARQDAVAKALKRHETAADALYESVATSTADCLAGLPPLTARPLQEFTHLLKSVHEREHDVAQLH